MNKNELCEIISQKTKKTTKQVQTVVSELLDLIQQSVILGEKVTLQGFGTVTSKKRPARIMRSFTGDTIRVQSTQIPVFRFSPSLKTAIKERNISLDSLKIIDICTKIRGKIPKIIQRGKIIGEYEFSEQEFKVMVDLLSLAVEMDNITLFGDKFAFSTLIEICKQWKIEDKDSQSGLWYHLSRKLNQNNDNKFRSTVTGLIDKITKSNAATEAFNTPKKYYATLMMHALAPKSSVYSLFDLCFNVFKKDLGFNFDKEENGWIIRKIARELREVFSMTRGDENKSVRIGSSQYFIQIGLRCLALHDGMNKEFEHLLYTIFTTINQLFHNDYNIPNKRSRIDNLLREWWQERLFGSEIYPSAISHRNNVERQSKVYAKYILNRKRNRVMLYVPPILLDSIEDNVVITTYVEGIESLSKTPFTRKGEMFVETTEAESDLNVLLGSSHSANIDIRVVIKINGKQIYDSSNKLKRDFILFDEINETKASVNPSSNYTLYSRDIDSLGDLDNIVHTIGENLYNIYPRIGDILSIGNRKVFFVERAGGTSHGTYDILLVGNKQNIVWHSSFGALYKVFTPKINLIVPGTYNVHSLEIRCEEYRQNLSRLEYETLDDGTKIFDLCELGIVTNGKPTMIEIYSHQKKKMILKESVYLLKSLAVKFDERLYYGDMPMKATVTVFGKESTYNWDNICNQVLIPFMAGQFRIPVPLLQWRINDREWNCREMKNIRWFKELLRDGDFLEIQASAAKTELFFTTIDEERHAIEKNKQNLFFLGRAIYAREKEEKISVYASAQFYDNSIVDCLLFHLSTKEHFVEVPILEANGSYFWNIENSFVGSSESKFKLIVKRDEKELIALPLPPTNKVLDELLPYFDRPGNYGLSVLVSNGKSIFGGFKEPLWQKNMTIDHPETIRLKGKKLLLSGAILQGEGIAVSFVPHYEIRYLKFDDTKSDEMAQIFTGLLFKDGNEVEYMYDEDGNKEEINPVIIEFRDKSSAYINPKSEEAFYYNKWERGIANRTDNKKTKYDSTLNKSVYFEDNSHYHNIDYFNFIEKNV